LIPKEAIVNPGGAAVQQIVLILTTAAITFNRFLRRRIMCAARISASRTVRWLCTMGVAVVLAGWERAGSTTGVSDGTLSASAQSQPEQPEQAERSTHLLDVQIDFAADGSPAQVGGDQHRSYMSGVRLKDLLASAFQVRHSQIRGIPASKNSVLSVVISGGKLPPRSVLPSTLGSALGFRTEEKTERAQVVVITGTPKPKPVEGHQAQEFSTQGWSGGTVAELALIIEERTGAIVLDETGDRRTYPIKIDLPAQTSWGSAEGLRLISEQSGLRMEAAERDVKFIDVVWVDDHR
jgi:hypothetical protein